MQEALATLDVGPDATREEVKAAYRRLALEHHPDRGSADGGRQFQAVSEAYGVLKDGAAAQAGAARPERRYGGSEAMRERRTAGAARRGAPPGQDWSRYTSEFEESSPGFWKEYEQKFWEEYEQAVSGNGRSGGGGGGGGHEGARERRAQPNLFVKVDPSLCIACQSCETIAPSVFAIDKNSNLNPKSRVINMRGAGVNKIMNAAETCPTRAISVDDMDAKRRMYPI